MAQAILLRAIPKMPAKTAAHKTTMARAKSFELNRAVRLAEGQIDRTGEVKSLPHFFLGAFY